MNENPGGKDNEVSVAVAGVEVNDESEETAENSNENDIPRKRAKRAKTSSMWKHFSIRLADDQKSEFAHCNYCTRFEKYMLVLTEWSLIKFH